MLQETPSDRYWETPRTIQRGPRRLHKHWLWLSTVFWQAAEDSEWALETLQLFSFSFFFAVGPSVHIHFTTKELTHPYPQRLRHRLSPWNLPWRISGQHLQTGISYIEGYGQFIQTSQWLTNTSWNCLWVPWLSMPSQFGVGKPQLSTLPEEINGAGIAKQRICLWKDWCSSEHEIVLLNYNLPWLMRHWVPP